MLEQNMVSNLEKKSISAVALNSDSIAAENKAGRNIWKACARGDYQIIFCSPERLASAEMIDLLSSKSLQSSLTLVVINEVHLIPTWGGNGSGVVFRSAFKTVGNLRSILSSHTVFLALTATLLPGKPTTTVLKQLGFEGPKFAFMKRDCSRPNLHLSLCQIRHTFTQDTFQDLDWLVPSNATSPEGIDKTVIYIDNIPRGRDIVAYLKGLLPPTLQPSSNVLIQHLYASACPQCKDEAMAEFQKTESCRLRIVAATEVFGCGVDIPDIKRVVIFGNPQTLDSSCQRIGRAGRGINDGYAYIYINPKLWDSTSEALGLHDRAKTKRTRPAEDNTEAPEEQQGCMRFNEVLKAHLTRRCLNRLIDSIYNNPTAGKPDRCGQCSGCIEDSIPTPREQAPSASANHTRGQNSLEIARITHNGINLPTTAMLKKTSEQISSAARTIWLETPTGVSKFPFDGLRSFLPGSQATLLAKNLLDINRPEIVRQILGDGWRFWDDYGKLLSAKILEVREQLPGELRGAYKDKQNTRKAQKPVTSVGSNHQLEGREVESESGAKSEDLEASCPIHSTMRQVSSSLKQPAPREPEAADEDI